MLCRDGLRHFECGSNQMRTGDNTPASVGAGKTLYSAIGRELGGSGRRQRLFNLAVTQPPAPLTSEHGVKAQISPAGELTAEQEASAPLSLPALAYGSIKTEGAGLQSWSSA